LPNSGNGIRLVVFAAWVVLLFVICFGLGYPTLNRYDPRSISGLSDSVQYYKLIEQGPEAATSHFKYRVFVPYLAKLIYRVAFGRLGSWNPTAFALLIVNSIFCAAAAFLVSVLAFMLSARRLIGVVAAFAYLLNFTLANYHLSGLVDSADAFLFVLLTWALMSRRWALLPAIGLLAGLSKETFIPIGFLFAITWVLSESSVERTKEVLAVIVMAVVGMTTVLVVRSAIDHSLVLPWNIVAQEHTIAGGFIYNLLRIGTEWNLWLTIVWLPFVFFAAQYIPEGWSRGALVGAVVTVALSAWNDVGRAAGRPVVSAGNVVRPLFDVVGPLFAISFALSVESLERNSGANLKRQAAPE
jgi:hypothetical protein